VFFLQGQDGIRDCHVTGVQTCALPIFINNNYLQFALQADVNGQYKSLGDAIRDAKNYTYQTSADITNNRKFTLLGDPALTLAFQIGRASCRKECRLREWTYL